MQLEESRRLTGPNLFSRQPGAICDIELAPAQQTAFATAWHTHVRRLLDGVGWHDSRCIDRRHATGMNVVITAPIDCLYAATDVNEAAVEFARCDLMDAAPPDLAATLERLQALIAKEANAALLALATSATDHDAPFLVDDDEVSVGFGAMTQIWPTQSAPAADDVDWARAGRRGEVPVALVTGTNGKSTTVRLAASIIAADDRTVGVTSTDYIRVGSTTIDTGDYSGPGGARQLLRHPDTEVALLEVARGGILRRGLGVTQADVALITNVAADHLGEYGIHTVDELRAVKFVVHKGLAANKPLVLNADDAGVVHYAGQLTDQRLVWFSEDDANPLIAAHCAAGGTAIVASHGQITLCVGERSDALVALDEIPVTLGGKARHNVQNALAAAALGHLLGARSGAIQRGLTNFAGGPDENPGRGNLFRGHGITAVVDFAHNEHGLRAMAETIASMPAKRRLVLMGQAGDRSDQLIRGLTEAALYAKPDQLVICQLPGYERGRAPLDVPRLIESTVLDAGVPATAIQHAKSPIEGTRYALDWATDGDLLLILALTQRGPCIQLIEKRLGA